MSTRDANLTTGVMLAGFALVGLPSTLLARTSSSPPASMSRARRRRSHSSPEKSCRSITNFGYGFQYSIGYDNGAKTVVLNVTQKGVHVLDIDKNGSADPLTDGLLIVRYLEGRTGSALINGVLGTNPMRTDPTEIKTFLDGVKPLLDIDDDGNFNPATDGILILRYLVGLRGDNLIAGAVGGTAQRKLAKDIEDYIASLMP